MHDPPSDGSRDGADPSDPGRLLSLAQGYMPARVLLTAVELGVFGCLAAGKASAAEIARRLAIEERAASTLLDALAALGILAKTGDTYGTDERTAGGLAEGHPNSDRDILAHLAHLWEPWSQLTQTVKTGRRPSLERGDAIRRDLAAAMRRYAQRAGPQAVRLIGDSRLRRILDLGGGAGTFALEFARQFPRLHAVVLDRDPQAIGLAERDIAHGGLHDRVSTRQADFRIAPIGNDYDLVLISCVLCTLSSGENLSLLTKAREALRAGGRIVVRDVIADDDETMSPETALFSVSLLLTTDNGQVYTVSRVRSWLRDAGFANVHAIPTEPARLVIGLKPEPGS